MTFAAGGLGRATGPAPALVRAAKPRTGPAAIEAELAEVAAGAKKTEADLAKRSDTAVVRALEAPNGLKRWADEIHGLAGKHPTAVNHSTVALARVRLADGSQRVVAAGSGGRLNPRQVKLLKQLGVSDDSISRGARVAKGFSKAENHAERIIARNLPEGATVEEWGISWGGKMKPTPCSGCAPIVEKSGGTLQR